ncbi:MAG: imelysin family protein, partial [Bacteroidota bacterium]
PKAIEDFIAQKEVNDSTMATVSPQIKALSAIEYLLFKEDVSTTHQKFINNGKRLDYLKHSTSFLKAQAHRLANIWDKKGGNYADIFINSKDHGIKGSFNQLFNGLYNAVNTSKVTKVGKPAGLERSPRTNPGIVQAPYSKQSLALLLQSVETVEEVFFGDGHSNISDYILFTSKDDKVNDLIRKTINEVKQAIAAIPVPLHEAVDSHSEEVATLHEKLGALNIWIAVDARSVLSIIVTSTDTDGD